MMQQGFHSIVHCYDRRYGLKQKNNGRFAYSSVISRAGKCLKIKSILFCYRLYLSLFNCPSEPTSGYIIDVIEEVAD